MRNTTARLLLLLLASPAIALLEAPVLSIFPWLWRRGVQRRRLSVFVAEAGNNRVSVFDAAGGFVRHIGEGKGAGPGQLSSPEDVAVGGDGTVFVAEPANNHRVSVFDAAGGFVRSVAVTEPKGVAVDGEGRLLVSSCKDGDQKVLVW